MSENLNKKPPKGILKSSSSFDKNKETLPSTSSGIPGPCGSPIDKRVRKSSLKFDEMNILETLHPPDKDYGHMKIEEPKTPFNYYEEGDDGEIKFNPVDPLVLSNKIEERVSELPSVMQEMLPEEDESSDSEDELDPVEKEKRIHFESKRKAHYNEYYAVKLARKLMEKESSGEEDEESDGSANCHLDSDDKFIPEVETEFQLDEDNNAADSGVSCSTSSQLQQQQQPMNE